MKFEPISLLGVIVVNRGRIVVHGLIVVFVGVAAVDGDVSSGMATHLGGPPLLFQTPSRRHLAARDPSSLYPTGQENLHLLRTEESSAAQSAGVTRTPSAS